MLFVGYLYRLNFLVIFLLISRRVVAFFHRFEEVLSSCVFLRFSAFIQREIATTNNEDSTTVKQSEHWSSTLIALLNSMKASIDSGNTLLQELLSHKRSSPDDETKTSQGRKSCTASQNAIAMSSHGDENDVSKEGSTQHHHDASEADAVSSFGVCDIDETEDTVLEEWGMENLTTVVCCLQSAFFLSCSQDTGPTVVSGLAELLNGKFNPP